MVFYGYAKVLLGFLMVSYGFSTVLYVFFFSIVLLGVEQTPFSDPSKTS